MNRFLTLFALIAITLFQFSTILFAGTLDDYYLEQFGEISSGRLQKEVFFVETGAQEPAQCGMPLKHALKRDWDLLEQATQKVLAKQLALPTLSGTKMTFNSPSGRFRIHYTTTGTDAVPSLTWVQTVAKTFDDVAVSYINRGWNLAPTTNGAPYDIYLLDLAPQKNYGVTTSDQPAPSTSYPNAFTSWMELDNNFTDSIYKPAIYTPLQSLQIAAAHEYHHAIQYGYNYYFETWYAEATSAWMEDELYDGINQLYSYIPAWFSNSIRPLDLAVRYDAVASGAGYGRWIFNRYLAEKHTPAMIRGAWEKVSGLNSPGSGADIPMIPVLNALLSSATYNSSLDTDFFGFAKRVYTRDWTDHPYDISKIHTYSPVTVYSKYPAYGSVTLPLYSFAYYKFSPPASSPNSLNITVTGTSGIRAIAFATSSSGIITEYPFTTLNNVTVNIPNFSSSSEVVLLLANTTSIDNHQASFSTDGNLVPVNEPTASIPITPNSSSEGGGGGCFIATAAYGSYLHPKVQLLRNFRDDYLLTNAPGRAFVALYYRYSPPLADFIASHAVLRSIARLALTPLFIAVVHPLITVASLLLLAGTILLSLLRRIRTARPISCPHVIHTTSTRL